MKLTILGCGGAAGVPGISSGWGACDPAEPRNRRLRSSLLIERGATRLLVDCSPDLRQQLLSVAVRRLDGVILTHDHADHLHGLDDLREVNRVTGRSLPLWGEALALDTTRLRFPYAFPVGEPPDGGMIWHPWLSPRPIDGPFSVNGLPVLPIRQDHGSCTTLGLRIGRAAYCTDVVDFPEESWASLTGLDVWIVGCLLDSPHPTHAHVDKVVGWVDRLKPRRTILTHMGSRLDYRTLCRRLPPGIEPAYDGLVIDLPDEDLSGEGG